MSKLDKPSGCVLGRPTKYRKEYCSMLVEHMSEGLSFESFAGVVNVSRSRIYEWREKHPVFQDAVQRGRSALLLHYETMGHKAMMGLIPGFRENVYKWKMLNTTHWTDKNKREEPRAEEEEYPEI